MTCKEMLDHAIARLQRRGRLTSGTLKRPLQLDDAARDARTDALLDASPEVHDDAGRGLIWSGTPGLTSSATAAAAPIGLPAPAPLTDTPPSLAEQTFTSRSALEGERTQVTVLFADLKGSMALLADRDPEEARQLLDPVLERMMAAVYYLSHAPLQDGIRDMGIGTRPPHHLPSRIAQQTPCTLDSPVMVRATCAAHLRRTAALAPGTVMMPLSSPGQEVTFPAWTRRRTTARPNNVSYACATFSRRCVVCQRRTPGVHKEGQPWLQARDPH
jgi:hypothetical protein